MPGKKAASRITAVVLVLLCAAGFALPCTVLAEDYEAYIAGASSEQSRETVTADFRLQNEETSSLQYSFTVNKSGLYRIGINYGFTAESAGEGLSLSLRIDGELPFTEADDFTLKTPWSFGKIEKDSRGNDIMPEQAVLPDGAFQWLYIGGGSYNTPALFYLKAGGHTLDVLMTSALFTVEKITVSGYSGAVPYSEYEKNVSDRKTGKAETITLEAERPFLRSDSSILPKYDIQNASTNPSSPNKMLLNALDGSNWTEAGQWVEWKFKIETAGYYEIDIKSQQSEKSGMSVYRQILIDGSVPFAELEAYPFGYSSGWLMETLHGENGNFKFYFEPGEHTVRLLAVLGDSATFSDEIFSVILKLNEIYRSVIMITGTSPDMFFDYDLAAMLPELKGDLENVLARLEDLKKLIRQTLGGEGDSSSLNSIIVQIKKFVSNINSIPQNITAFNSNITALSTWAQSFKSQPLSIDTIYIRIAETPPEKANTGFFERFIYMLRNIIATFSSDYGVIGEINSDSSAVEVWVSNGRDQAQLIKRLASSEYDGNVNISLVQAGLLEAVMAGVGPDAVLYVGQSNVINYAARGALEPLESLSDFDSVRRHYNDDSFIPLTYRGYIYALPLVSELDVMFYRTDILEQLKIECPKTWEELFEVLPVIEGQNMNIGLGTSMFAHLLFQQGGRYYNDDLSDSALTEESAMAAFKKWTEFYTLYACPVSYDFFNRFRTGEMPIGVANYSMYTQLEAAAPEISGLWEMTALPYSADGKKNVIAGGELQTAVVLSSGKNIEKAWDFVKWFASTPVQTSFGTQIEAALGPLARYQAANLDVIPELAWSDEQTEFILGEMERMEYVPQTPSSSYLSRQLNNAFRSVIYDGENYRGALYRYNTLISTEILRKNKQLEKYY